MSKKGPAFERKICTLLSEWWSQDTVGGPRDDLFWRTAGSGGRATTRTKRGKKTVNADGDICATDRIAEPFLKLVAIEIKRGYSRHTFAALLDRLDSSAEQEYEAWIKQAQRSQQGSGAHYWMIIVQRDRRETLCLMPTSLYHQLAWFLPWEKPVRGSVTRNTAVQTPRVHLVTPEVGEVTILRLRDFLKNITTNNILSILDWMDKPERKDA